MTDGWGPLCKRSCSKDSVRTGEILPEFSFRLGSKYQMSRFRCLFMLSHNSVKCEGLKRKPEVCGFYAALSDRSTPRCVLGSLGTQQLELVERECACFHRGVQPQRACRTTDDHGSALSRTIFLRQCQTLVFWMETTPISALKSLGV